MMRLRREGYGIGMRRGIVAAQLAMAMVPLCGVAAIALDCGSMLDARRKVQAAADAAALSAAQDLYQRYATNNGVDLNGSAAQSARDTAAANGYASGGTTSTVTVNIPPTSGTFQSRAGFAEVIVQYNHPRGFSAIWGSSTIPVTGRAVARGLWASFANGIIVLSPTGRGALTDTGNGSVTVNGASIVVNSSDPQAVVVSGNASIKAPQLQIAGSPGDVVTGNGKIIGGIESGTTPTVDPLRYLPAPSANSLTLRSSSKISVSGTNSRTLDPGLYVGGVSVSGSAKLTLNPGTYYFQGGGFSFSGTGTMSANGVMLYNAPVSSSDMISISGNSGVSLSPPTSGTYQGISIFQDRTSSVPMNISGNAGTTLSGTFYAAKAALNVTGNAGASVLGSQYLSYDLNVTGNGSVSVNWSSDKTGRTRSIGLVE